MNIIPVVLLQTAINTAPQERKQISGYMRNSLVGNTTMPIYYIIYRYT